jgi:hypothetical protein
MTPEVYLWSHCQGRPHKNKLANIIRESAVAIAMTTAENFVLEVEGSGLCCTLCNNAGPMTRQVYRLSHCQGRQHQNKLANIIRESALLDVSNSSFRRRIHNLGLPRWQWHVNSRCLEWIFSGGNAELGLSLEATLRKYELMEQLSLLELAVWKASIFANNPFLVTMADLHDAWAMDEAFDYKQYMKECRVTSGAHVIVQGPAKVLQFG